MKFFPKHLSYISAMLVFYAAAAHATRITNLDTIPYDLKVSEAGEEKMIAIEPNQTLESTAFPLRVFYRKKWNELDHDADFAIWKGGTLTRQKLGPQGRSK